MISSFVIARSDATKPSKGDGVKALRPVALDCFAALALAMVRLQAEFQT